MRIALLTSLAAVAITGSPVIAQEAKPVEEQIGSGGRPVGANWSRSPVIAQNGMAATAHPLATQIALDILKSGGTAVDAAIAANAALGLMEPTGNGIGGDLFAIVYDPKTDRLYGINGSGRSPKGQTLADLRQKLGDRETIPPVGPLPVTVPGTVDAWFELHAKFGELPMSEILAPTVKYGREGHPVAPVIAMYFERGRIAYNRRLQDYPFEFENARATYFKGGRSPVAGEIFKNPDLAQTLETIGREGRDAFYEGEIAQTMVEYLRRQGSEYTLDDFA